MKKTDSLEKERTVAIMTEVEAIARAWASMDGRLSDFIACKDDPKTEERDGRYGGYMADAEELLRRAKSIRSSTQV